MRFPRDRRLAIFDTGIVLQATLNPDGPAERALQTVERGLVTAVMSNRLRSEYEDILTRPALRLRHAALQQTSLVEGQLERIDALFRRVANAPERIAFPRDPKDAPTINLAAEIGADFIIARDRDLLDLNADRTFRKICPQTRVLDPVEFLNEMDAREISE